MANYNKSLPVNAVYRKSGWWIKNSQRFRKCILHGLCEVCGKEIWRAIGHDYKFCSCKCKASVQTGKPSPNWKGGIKKNTNDYVFRYLPTHPNSDSAGYIAEHRLQMSLYLGRSLQHDEHVHHKNKITSDNRIANLELLPRSEHIKLHATGRIVGETTRQKLS